MKNLPKIDQIVPIVNKMSFNNWLLNCRNFRSAEIINATKIGQIQ